MKYLLFAFILFTSCKYSRQLSKTEEKTSVKIALDSGEVKTAKQSNKLDSSYFRETIVYTRPGDTTVNNNYYNSYPQPSVIIRESGVKQVQQEKEDFSSIWLKYLKEREQETKTKESVAVAEFMSPMQMLALCLGIGVVLFIVLTVAVKFFVYKMPKP